MTPHRHHISLYGSIMLLVLGVIISACDRFSDTANPARQSLRLIAEIVSDHPQEALDSLKAVDYSRLSTADRHYYDLLSIKGADKAYITHTSDSLILDVIDYYSTHQKEEFYPDALYYGGRVYSDLGDYPTALDYFQQALELLPAETEKKDLRGRVLSQTASLLSTLRLYAEAIPYVQSAIELGRVRGDTLGLMHDTQLLGTTYLHLKDWDKAEAQFRRSSSLAQTFTKADIARQRMYLAATKYGKGELDSARLYMRGVLDHISPLDRSTALAYYGYIYLNSDQPDSAYNAAMELIRGEDLINKDKGYYILTSPLMDQTIAQDSLIAYLRDYHRYLNRYLNTNANEQALIQQSSYNYSLHQRERDKAEDAYHSLQRLLVIGLIVGLIAALIRILIIYKKKKDESVRIFQALILLRTLPIAHSVPYGRRLSHASPSYSTEPANCDRQPDYQRPEERGRYLPLPPHHLRETEEPVVYQSFPPEVEPTEESIEEYAEEPAEVSDAEPIGEDIKTSPSASRNPTPDSLVPISLDEIVTIDPATIKKQLIEELTAFNDDLDTHYIAPDPILHSETYASLRDYLHRQSPVPPQSEIWEELEKLMVQCCPDFTRRLHILTGSKVKPEIFHFILLIKCDFSSSQIAILQGRGKPAIVARHKRLSMDIFGETVPLSKIWRLIQSL